MENEPPTSPDSRSAKDLSEDEMQDLVVVAIARTTPEAVFISETLEDAEIPAAMRNDNLGGLINSAYETRICVPRALQERAKDVIAKARNKSEDESVAQAFETENVEESLVRAPVDGVLDAMLSLRDLELESRKARLEEYLAGWLRDDVAPVDIARYLAAAGLDLPQSDALLQKVRAERSDTIENSQSGINMTGLGMVCCAVLLFGIQLMIHSSARIIILPTGLFIAGISMMLSGSKPIPKSLLNDPLKPTQTDKPT